MSEKRVKLAVIGLTDEAQELLDIADRSGCYTVTAVGDERAERAEICGRKYECQTFTDFRQLIIQAQADFLLFGAPVHQCGEYIRLAIAEHYHILQMCPPALSFEQLAAFYHLAKKEQVLFLTLQPGRFSASFSHVRDYLNRGAMRDEPAAWHLVTGVCHVPTYEPTAQMRWMSDPKMAGGGVLLHQSYSLIDQLLLCFGLPQRVYALTMSQAPDRQQRMSLTEDTAVAVMQFSDTLIAQVTASRTLGPARRHLRLHGRTEHLTATDEAVEAFDNSGTLLERRQFTDDEQPRRRRMLEHIALSYLEPQVHAFYPGPGFDLQTLAVIEAAYLSSRTGMAEEPARILKLAETNPAGML